MTFRNMFALLLSLQYGCEADSKSTSHIEFLKDSGYKRLSCNLAYNNTVNSYDFTAEVVPVSNNLEMLLARCSKNGCDFKVIKDNSTPNKILCQRYYNNDSFDSEFDKDQLVLTFNTKYFLDIKE